MASTEPEAWMRPALAWLFEHADPVQLRSSISDPASLTLLRGELERSIPPFLGAPIPGGDRGDNLILALIALRLKFPRPEAEQKLEKNLTLRQGQ